MNLIQKECGPLRKGIPALSVVLSTYNQPEWLGDACTAICVHLDHPWSYATEASIAANHAIRAEVLAQRLVWAEHGLRRGKPETTLQRPESTVPARGFR